MASGKLFFKPRSTYRPLDKPSGNERILVLAPHQDDETLGCGGRIIQLQKAGAEVTVVYTTDGRLANCQFMESEEVVLTRKAEAIAACDVLGIPEENVVFLGFHDASLSAQIDAVAKELMGVILQCQPTEIYFPYSHDFHPDHEATTQAAMKALESYHPPYSTFEYLVWGIYHLPWITLPTGRDQKKLVIKNTLKLLFGWKVKNAYKHAVYTEISEEKSQKWEALMKHRSQVSRLVDNDQWLVLDDVANGSWIKQFQGDHEVYRKTDYKTT